MKNIFDRSIINNLASLFSLRIAGYIIPLMTLPYLVSVLGVTNFGRMSFSVALIQYFILVVGFGFDLSVTKKVAENKKDRKYISDLYFSVISIRVIFSLFGFMLLLLISSFDNIIGDNRGVIIAAYISVFGVAIFPQWLFQGKEALGTISAIRVFCQALTIPLLFVFVKSSDDLVIATYISSLPFILVGLISICIIYQKEWVFFSKPSIVKMKNEILDSYPLFISGAASSLYTNSVPVVLGFFGGVNEVAIYTAAHKLVFAIQGLYTPVTTAFYPRISSKIAENKKEAIYIIKTLIKVTTLIAGAASFSILLLSPIAVSTLYSGEFENSITIMRILCFLPLFVGLSNAFGIQTLINFGHKKIFMKIIVYLGFVSFLSLILSSIYYGAQGVAITVITTEFLITLTMYIYIKKNNILKI